MAETQSKAQDTKAFELYELRKELMNIDYNLKLIAKNCTTLNINLQKNDIVIKELSDYSNSTKVYDRCGRMFVLSSKSKMIEKLNNNKKKMISEIDSQNQKKKILEQNLNEQTKAYLELAKSTEKK